MPEQVSSYFPNAQPRLAPMFKPRQFERPSPYLPHGISTDPPGLWEGVRTVAPPGVPPEPEPQSLQFPAVRSVLWDRNARGAPALLQAATPHAVLPPAMLTKIAYELRRSPEASAGTELRLRVELSPPPAAGTPSRVVTPPLNVVVVGVDRVSLGDEAVARQAGAPTPHGEIPVHLSEWPRGTELRPSDERYVALLQRGVVGVEMGKPLAIGEVAPM